MPSPSRRVVLIYDDRLVGYFTDTDMVAIEEAHQGCKLGRELVLAAFAQKGWKDMKARKVTKAGETALRNEWRLARMVAGGRAQSE